ncbi:hypothetical protein T4C_4035 [Trichinella pseudospiralis]|uniref:Uncharacterized protein n=1 Tax=Trichinella pseudospiralis TaxID=6337 RepID=A0A0V1J359_TRIPS|nr:hypothetical protein T4C_4035 [Trichinella pseudospiralis]
MVNLSICDNNVVKVNIDEKDTNYFAIFHVCITPYALFKSATANFNCLFIDRGCFSSYMRNTDVLQLYSKSKFGAAQNFDTVVVF